MAVRAGFRSWWCKGRRSLRRLTILPPGEIGPVRSYVLPVIFVGLAGLIRFFSDEALQQEAPFLLLLTAVTASAFLGSFKAGAFATALAFFVALGFMHPRFDIINQVPARQFRTVVFLGEATVITSLCTLLHRARRRSELIAEEARRLQREVSDASDRTQQRIGQDLHDDLGQFLTGLALSLQRLARRLEVSSQQEADDVRRLVNQVNEAVNRVRQLARGLAPMTVESDSLVLLLAELQERSDELGSPRVTFEVTGNPPDLPRPTVMQLYRIAQEAVSNALRHAGASRIDIRLRCDDDRLVLSVEDDGVGFDVRKPKTEPSMGLRVQQFRANLIEADLAVSPARPGSERPGTLVVCELPISGRVGLDVATATATEGS